MALNLIPTEKKFFTLYETQADFMCEATRIFLEMISHWNERMPHIDRIRVIEHEADITTHEIIDLLNRTFVTPLDREDIHRLASEMDDVVDMVKATTNRMHIYKLKDTTPELIRLAEVLVQSAIMVRKSIGLLRDSAQSFRLREYCIEINRLENEGDIQLENALDKLFSVEMPPVDVMKWKEIYEATESAIDKCEHVANILDGIRVKHGS
ncbi:MAG TPA: DUF47 family protein [Elusimicrobiota bacterium]|nr:DUF47 family protein [Elusimicrobiota bacterium]